MKLKASWNFFVIAALAVLVVVSASFEARGQGRSRRASGLDKKCAKFVNCHDASEGRVDGRGPRRGTDVDNWDWRRARRDRDLDRDGSGRHRRGDIDRDGTWRRRGEIDRDGTWRRRGEIDRDGTWRRRGEIDRDGTWRRRGEIDRDRTSRRGNR
jgi:hypothetical protein